jgi:hypothetical protein
MTEKREGAGQGTFPYSSRPVNYVRHIQFTMVHAPADLVNHEKVPLTRAFNPDLVHYGSLWFIEAWNGSVHPPYRGTEP